MLFESKVSLRFIRYAGRVNMDLAVGTARQSTDREWRGSIVSVHASTEAFLELCWLHSSVRFLALDAIRCLSSSETTGCKIRKCKGDRVVVSSVSVPRSCLRSVRRGIRGCGIAPLRRRNIVPQRRKQHRVFLAHDEFVIASSFRAIMRHQCFDARSLTNRLKARSSAAAEAPELLICDLAMRLLSGSELARQVREYSPDCSALLFPSQGMNGNLGKYDRLGQRVQILTMVRRPPELSKRADVENEFAY